MIRLRTVRRIAGRSALVLLVLFLGLLATVQAQQWLLRWRAERLMADMHRIRLYQTTWAEAQALMRKWGAWGHWDGVCTADDCRYAIQMGGPINWAPGQKEPNRAIVWLLVHDHFGIYELLGGRSSFLSASFAVHQGTIWRESAGMGVDDRRPGFKRPEGFPLTLMAGTQSNSSLHTKRKSPSILGSEDELSKHPFYLAGRPGGCEVNCKFVRVTYSTHTPPEEIERLTTFNFQCLTPNPFHPCETLADLLPAEKPWDVYADNQPDWTPPVPKTKVPKPCDIPVWALARDYGTAMVVEVEAKGVGKGYDEIYELDRARIVAVIKGKPRWPVGAEVKVAPFSGESVVPPFYAAEHLTIGQRYIVFPAEEYYGLPRDYDDRDLIETTRCAAQPDTPGVRAEVQKGMAMDDEFDDRWR